MKGSTMPHSTKSTLSISILCFLLTTVCIAAQQEKPPTSKPAASPQEKETKVAVAGTVVNDKGLPLKAQSLELYMVVEGAARDAYGNPLKGAIDIGTNRQVISLMMFPVKTTTDAVGHFSMELPNYFLVPSGLRLTGWTIVNLDTAGKVHALNTKGEMLMINPNPDETKVELGKLTLSAATLGGS
jgi:hypothetical protein